MGDEYSRLVEASKDRCRIEREIGHGGMAVVYLAIVLAEGNGPIEHRPQPRQGRIFCPKVRCGVPSRSRFLPADSRACTGIPSQRTDTMVQSSMFLATGILSIVFTGLVSGSAAAQEPQRIVEPEPEEHEFHRNHFGGFLGTSLTFDPDAAAPTLGLEYARQFSPHWAVAVYTELVSSRLERDIIVAVGGIFYPTSGLGLILAVGAEAAEKEIDRNGEIELESELGLLLRVGAGYSFRLTPEAALGPTLFVDRVGDRTTLVFGLGVVVGF